MYGVPSRVVWEPAGEGAVTSSDIALALPSRAEAPRTAGVLEQIWVAASAGEPARALADGRARAGLGLEGDRHTIGTGIVLTRRARPLNGPWRDGVANTDNRVWEPYLW